MKRPKTSFSVLKGMARTAQGMHVLWGVLLALLLTVTPLSAVTYTVTTLADTVANDSVCSLREAIQEANNGADTDCAGLPSAGNDTITFSVSGTIVLGATLPNIVDAATAGALTIDGGGNITISGNNAVRVMIINSGADLTLQNLTIVKGSGFAGGGIYNNGGTLSVTSSTFSANIAAGGGGGIYNNGGTLTVTSSTFSGNLDGGGGGGGILNSGTLAVTSSTFSANTGAGGGGIHNSGTLTITNSTFSANTGLGGGGIRNTGTATLKNTIIANSQSGGDCVGTLSGSSINNLIEDSTNACGLVNGVNGNIIGVDPNLGTLTGSPAYFPLNPGSPAIDTADNATCAAAPVNNQSQNGITRPQDGDGNGTATCDIGSFEAPAAQADMVASLGSLPPSMGPGGVYNLSFSCTNAGSGDAYNATCGITAAVGTVSSVNCTPSVPVSTLAAGGVINCTFSYTAPGPAGGTDVSATGVTFTVTAGAIYDTNSANNTASNASPIPIVDALDDAASFPANTTQTYNVGSNDQYGAGSLPSGSPSPSFLLLTGSTTCASASITSPGGVASFQVPASGTCVLAYRVCVISGCDTAQLVVTAQQQQEPIPTLDQWALFALIVLTAGAGLLLLRRMVV